MPCTNANIESMVLDGEVAIVGSEKTAQKKLAKYATDEIERIIAAFGKD